MDLLNTNNKLELPIRIVHKTLKARVHGEKEPRVWSAWLRHPIPGDKITDEGKHLTQHKYTKRGIKHISFLEEAIEETSN